jgi:geranyl-CoA carboxylase alpha subunit
VTEETHFASALRSARSEALAAFGDGDVLLERALVAPRHVEVQIFADAFGNVVHLGERDCSVQRRHQKLIEEAPSPAVDDALRERLGAVAIAVARSAKYVGAGTVEFLLDADGSFWFIEVNARLQVEHPVTEAITGFDLVEWQLRIARGEPLPREQSQVRFTGHAIEARVCAEDPARDFLPQTGTLLAWTPPPGLRTEHALEPGISISPYYDSMIAKAIAFGDSRESARARLTRGLEGCVALGVPTNVAALLAIVRDDVFASGSATTRFIEERLSPARFTAEPEPVALALFGALLYALAADRGAFGSWASWSSSHVPTSTLTIAVDDRAPHAIAIVPNGPLDVVASIGAQSFRIAFADLAGATGRPRARIDGGAWRHVDFARDGALAYVALDGRTYAVADRSAEPALGASGGAGDGFLRAPMSGRVASVAAGAGTLAKAGSPLATLEAMKMEHVLSLPVDVILGEITAVVGAQVHANDVLLAYEPATG